MATNTPLALTNLGRLPPREGDLSSRVAPSVVEVLPGLYLIATIVREKNRCLLELLQPTPASTDSVAHSSALTHEDELQRRLSQSLECSTRHASTVNVPATLKSGFRVPRVIQLVAEDEGIIETVCLVREPLLSSSSFELEGQEDSTALPTAVNGTSAAPISHAHVHFFIGTSNGTVLVGNALRGTILAIAQFQYHHRFDDERRGERLTTTSISRTGDGRNEPEEGCPMNEKGTAVNQSVVKFVVRHRPDALLWNPSIPFSHLSTGAVSKLGASHSAEISDTPASPTVNSSVLSVYVTHSGGKVVELSRSALDVFVRVSVNRLDGRRPHLILEWSPETSTTAFPVAGPASEFAAHVSCVSVLAFSPASYSSIESRTASTQWATTESTTFSICDADIVREPSGDGAPPLLSPLEARRNFSDVLLVGGANPLFSSFHLHPPPSRFSASNTVEAVKNMVTGVARSLWLKAIGTSKTVERPPHLKKVAARRMHTLVQADAKCTALQADPTQQWAALAIEGGGRIYVADVQTGVIATVLKGCRAAQFTWWWTELAGGRPALLLVVYLPLRRAVEVYTTRTWQRLAARHVPQGSVLLQSCGAPCEVMRGTPDFHGYHRPAAACNGNGAAPLLMDPAGHVFRVGIQWVLDNPQASLARLRCTEPASLRGDAGEMRSFSETRALSTSVLRSCKTPDDFLELALKLPLPCPRVERLASAGGGCRIAGGDEVRAYLNELTVLCETLQHRFAPGYAEIAVTPLPSTEEDILNGAVQAVPHGVTAAQCLHYVQVYASLVENYQRLLTCKDVTATLYFDPQQWISSIVTPDLWKATFSITAYPGVAAFVKTMDTYVAAALSAHPGELLIYKKHVATYLQQVMRGPPCAATAVSSRSTCPTAREPVTSRAAPLLAHPSSFMPLPVFMRCFYAGSMHPKFLRGAIEGAEDSDGSVSILGRLSDLVFGVWGVDSFLAQLPALRHVGFGDSDIAHITVTWVARQAGRDLAALLSTTTVGCLAATLLSFSDEHFAAALSRAPIPFVSVTGELATRAATDSVTGLLWCCAVRMVLQRRSSSFAQSELILRRVRQLLQLWNSFSKCSAPPSNSESTEGDLVENCNPALDDAVALYLRLSAVEPSCAWKAEVAGHVCVTGGQEATATNVLAYCEGDVLEVYLQRNGITTTLLDGFAVPRADGAAARLFPLFSNFASLLGEAGYASDPDTVVVQSLAWIDGQKWDGERFSNAVLRPIEQLWRQLCSTSTKDGTDAPWSRSAAGVYASCLTLVTMCVLQHALRPLTDVDFFFWETDSVPDGNFFPVDGTPAGLVLSGSRTTRDYLNSVQQLSSLLESILLRTVAPLENAERAHLIQQVSLALAADDALLFPLVPKFLRVRLTIWMQVLAQTPRAPLRRTQRVRRLVELILFFSDVSSLTVGGVPLTQLQSYLSVPWKVLLGGPSRRVQLQLLPTVTLTDGEFATACRASPVANPSPSVQRTDSVLLAYAAEEEEAGSAPLNIRAASTVLRKFLAAGGVLYAKQRAPAPIANRGSTPCLGLIAEDTRQALARLAQCFGVQESFPDIADVVLMDYEIKHLFPVSTVEQEMLLLSSKGAAPQVAASALQSFLVLILQYMSARREGYRRRGDRASYETASKELSSMARIASVELRAWLQERENEMTATATPESMKKRGAAGGQYSASPDLHSTHAVAAKSVLAPPGWVTAAEHQEMGRVVSSVLSTGRGSAAHKDLFHLLFTLSQWACEGRLYLPSAAQRVAHELPLIVERWERLT